jgi:hypothetical protein
VRAIAQKTQSINTKATKQIKSRSSFLARTFVAFLSSATITNRGN